MDRIEIMRPLLPKKEAITKYLDRIDESRWYSNGGALVKEYESRLQSRFGVPAVATSSCTSALTACLLALDLPRGSTVAVPSFTFAATVHAILAAGHLPYFVDMNPLWSIDMWPAEHLLKTAHPVNAAIYVSQFGAPVKIDVLDEATKRSGIPIIVDAAGAFDAQPVGKTPVCISTHCTKVFGSGEGGMVLSSDAEFLNKVREICNFGFDYARDVAHIGINGKMSEYHAAVGLASLDTWSETREKWHEIKKYYVEAFSDISLPNPLYSLDWVGSLFNIRLSVPVEPLIKKLADKGVMARQIWGNACHKYAGGTYGPD